MGMGSTRSVMRRFPALRGWANRILRVNLSEGTVSVQETVPYVPDYIGGRGVAAAIVWDEYPEPVDPLGPDNPLIVMTGALTGSPSASSGRTAICGFSPQGYPYRWFSRSNIGGRFGGELKRAGYDGIVVVGSSDVPVRLLIRDDEVSILPADDLWGMDVLQTLESLDSLEGGRSLVIGPAGERLSLIATIQTASSSAAGHCGFGAVMGSKKLKAITVVGSGRVALADADEVRRVTRAMSEDLRGGRMTADQLQQMNAQLAAEGSGSVRTYACTEACPSPCGLYYKDVPGCAQPDRTFSGHWFCVGGLLRGQEENGLISRRGVFDWRLGVRGGQEMNVLSNAYGLNQWDLIIGLVPWLGMAQRAGLISEINGMLMDWRSCDFWAHFLHAVAYREGIGDVLAEGGWAASRALALGEDIARRFYTGWGHAGHWDGHADLANYVVYPYWLVSALQWLTDTRDPIPSGHGYASRIMGFAPLAPNVERGPQMEARIAQLCAIGERLYGTADAVDPYGGYLAKDRAGVFHAQRSVMKDCVPGDDFIFPRLYSRNTEDGFARIAGIDGHRLEYHLFRSGTGVDWTENEFEEAALRVYTLERALTVRHWGRDRRVDEMVLPAFEYRENWASPLLGERMALDRKAFAPVVDAYYRRLGWDPATGWPTQERLDQLDMPHVYEPMVQGAQRARATQPEPPQAEIVVELAADA